MRVDRKVERFQENLGESWWWRRFSDVVDRRNPDGTHRPFDYERAARLFPTKRNKRKYAEQLAKGLPIEVKAPVKTKQANASAPPKLERPEGMTRQAHRRLYREACKLAGVPWRTERLFYTPRRERGRNWKDLSPEALAELEAQWAEYMTSSLKVE